MKRESNLWVVIVLMAVPSALFLIANLGVVLIALLIAGACYGLGSLLARVM